LVADIIGIASDPFPEVQSMFSSNDILFRLRQTPFVPVRITINSGQTFDIFHPDLVLIGHPDLIIGMASKKNPATYEQTTRMPIMRFTAWDDLPVSSTSSKKTISSRYDP
jgi:hypothetical protein